MAHAAYDGIFLAPESIVTFPGLTPSDLDGYLQTDLTGVRAERFAEPNNVPVATHPNSSAFSKPC